jgi:drug/metabolite transporter (DMT)-like permease
VTAGPVLAYLTCALIWGTTWWAIRACIGPGGYPTAAAAALRFLLCAAILAPALALGLGRPGPSSRRQWAWLLGAAVLSAANYACVYLAEERVSGGVVAVIFATSPIVTALLTGLLRIERTSRSAFGAAFVGLFGVGLLFRDRLEVSAEQAAGVALGVVAVVLSATYGTIVKVRAAGIHPLATTTLFCATTGTVFGAWWAVDARSPPWPPPPGPTVALLYLAIFGTIVAFTSYFYLVRRVSLVTTSTLVFAFPVIALALDAFVEKRVRLSAAAYAGAALALAGVVGMALVERRSRA